MAPGLWVNSYNDHKINVHLAVQYKQIIINVFRD